jgi:hypothetical protein
VTQRGRPAKYPWNDWLDGETRHVLNQVEHFPGVTAASVQQQALTEARKRGIRVSTQTKTVGGVEYLELKPAEPEKKKRRDWDAIFAQPQGVVLRRERDFTSTVSVMRAMVHQAAARRHLTVRTTADKTSVTIYPQDSATGMASKKQEA